MITLATHDAVSLLHRLADLGGWRTSETSIFEAVPHLAETLSPHAISEALSNLAIPHRGVRCRERHITAGECPAIVIPDHGRPFIVTGRDGNELLVDAGPSSPATRRMPRQHSCLVIRVEPFLFQRGSDRTITVSEAFGQLTKMLPWLLTLSLVVNVLGLFAPLLIMLIYDRVIPAGSVHLILSLLIGVLVILISDFGFRMARTHALAHIGKNAERVLSLALFRKLMALPLSQLQKSEVDQQLLRFRQFEALREMFTGQILTTMMDLPFALLFFGLILYLAPVVGLMVLAAAILLFFVSLTSLPKQQRLDAEAAVAVSETRTLIRDAVTHQNALVKLGLTRAWQARVSPVLEFAEDAIRRARQFQSTTQNAAQSVTSLTTICATVFSAQAAMTGQMSFGALIAVIALVSKVMAPIHALQSNLQQVLSARSSRVQADRVLALPEEIWLNSNQSHLKTLSGNVSFAGVTYRPDPSEKPVLAQVSFVVHPGELVVIMSPDLMARKAALDLVAGLHDPLSGSIEHDDIDIRQIARDELRRSISYMPQRADFFHGTVLQNIRLSAAGSSVREIQNALDILNFDQDLKVFPDRLNTRLTNQVQATMTEDTRQSLSLVRAMTRPARIWMFSEPTNGLSAEKRDRFKAWLNSQRAERTVIIATADWSFIPLADRCIYLDEGRVTVNDTGQSGQKKIRAMLAKSEARP